MSTSAARPKESLARIPAGSFVQVDDLPGSRGAAASALSRASKRGELVSVRKGLYFKGVKTRYGMTRPSPEAVATTILGKEGVGPTGYSAARAFGLTTQVPANPALTVAGPVPTSLHGVKVSKRNNMRRRDLNYLEIALLELLRGEWKMTVDGGWAALSKAAANAISAGDVGVEKLADAVAGERSPEARSNWDRLLSGLPAQRR